MPRSRQCFSYASFAKHGATVALAAVLAVSSVPAAAMVQAASGESPQLAYAVENGEVKTPDGFYMVPGQSYEIGIDCVAMGNQMFGETATVSFDSSTNTYNLAINLGSLASSITSITCDGISANISDSKAVFSGVESVKQGIAFAIVATVNMGENPMTMPAATLTITSVSNLPTESTTPSEPDTGGTEEGGEDSGTTGEGEGEEGGDTGEVTDPATETKSVSYFVKDSGNAFSGMLPSDIQVAQDPEGGYSISIPVSASTIGMVNNTFWVKDSSGSEIKPAIEEDGTYTYTIHADDVDGAVEFSIGYTVGPMSNTHNMIMRFFDCSAINSALGAAKSIKDDGTEAYTTFEQAYAAAKETVSNPKATADDLNNAAEQLNTAIEAYNAATGEGEGSETVTTPDGLELIAGETYNAPVSFWNKNTGEESMAAGFMNKVAQVVYDADSETYTVTISSINSGDIGSISYNGTNAEKSGNFFTISGIKNIGKDITLGMYIPLMEQAIGNGNVEALMRIDTDNMVLASEGNPPVVDDETTNNNNNQNNNNNNNGQNNTTVSTARFVVGHTYEVPLSIMQSGTSTTSMAAQYFGDSAYVRPLENGTMDISFTTNRLDYINSLSYNGSELSRSGSTYTVNVPYTESDLVLRMAMGIAPMQELGMGTVTADFHFQLSQANDLGTNVTSNPSSASSLPKTADTTNGVAGLAALAGAGLVAAGVSRFARRRS